MNVFNRNKLAFGFCSFMLASGTCAVYAADNPNVVLFFVDDMGWSDNDVFGNEGFYETPNMQRLANQGVKFTQSYSSGTVCSPTRVGLMTGKNPAGTHVTNWTPGSSYNGQSRLRDPSWTKNMSSNEFTLAEAMRSADYETAHVGKWHTGTSGSSAADPLKNGFDVNIGGNHKGSPPGGYFAGSDGSWNAPGLNTGTYASDAYLTDVLTDHAIDFMEENRNKSFFLELNHYAVHAPIQAPAGLVAKYQAKLNNKQEGEFLHHKDPWYAAMIETMDNSLGRVLDTLSTTLDENGKPLAENTIVIFTSDHGGLATRQGGMSPLGTAPTSSYPLSGGKGSVAEGGVRVPTIISMPGNAEVTAGTESDALLVSHDYYQAILDLTGAEVVPPMLGGGGRGSTPVVIDMEEALKNSFSIRSALEGGDGERSKIYWHYPHISDQAGVGGVRNGRFFTAVREDEWKLIYNYEDESWELYNIDEDLDESENLAPDHVALVREMGEEMSDWLVEVKAQLPIDSLTGQAVRLPVLPVAVPEPSTLGVLGVGGALLMKRVKR